MESLSINKKGDSICINGFLVRTYSKDTLKTYKKFLDATLKEINKYLKKRFDMEGVECIPGDLVIFQGKVTAVRECRGNYYVLNCQKPIEDVVYRTDLIFIPLTSEILKKNGWFEDSFIDDYNSFYKNDKRYSSLHRQNTQNSYAFDIDLGETTVMVGVKYVHQLQHLLFGLGLPMDLKV